MVILVVNQGEYIVLEHKKCRAMKNNNKLYVSRIHVLYVSRIHARAIPAPIKLLSGEGVSLLAEFLICGFNFGGYQHE